MCFLIVFVKLTDQRAGRNGHNAGRELAQAFAL